MKRSAHYTFSFCLVLFLWIFPARAAAQAEPATLVIEGGTLIDGNGGAPVRDAVILIQGNKITTVSRKGQASYPAGAQVLRADGKFILPGLMDAHCHYFWYMGELMLAHGVTSIFEIGGGEEAGLAQREAISRGKVVGPRTFLAVGSLAGGAIAAARGGGTGLESPLTNRRVVSTAEEAREVARRYIAAGADMIKVHRGPPLEVYQAAIEEAHKAGLPVVVQPLGPTVYAKEAVLAGADILEHAAGVNISILKDPSKWKEFGARADMEAEVADPTPFADMDEAKAAELIRLMVQRKVYLEPDFILLGRGFQKGRARFEAQDRRLFSDARLAYYPERERLHILGTYREFDTLEESAWERRNKGYQNMLRFIRQFVEAGGKVLTGTDTGGWAVPGLGLHHELEILVEEAGLTPLQVIQAATRWPAEAFRVLDRVGTIEAGKLADLMIVNADPLQNIANLQKIEWVIQDGRVVDRSYHRWFSSPFTGSRTVEALAWVAALKRQTFQRDPTYAIGQPTPGIESISPTMVTEGSPTLTLTIKGVFFTGSSFVYFDNQPVPTQQRSETELKVTINESLLRKAGTFPIVVRNPEPLQRPEWGDGASNKAHLIVNFRY